MIARLKNYVGIVDEDDRRGISLCLFEDLIHALPGLPVEIVRLALTCAL